jgi:hypothetical protein
MKHILLALFIATTSFAQGLSGLGGLSGLSSVASASTGIPTNGLIFWLDADDATTLFQDEAGTTPITANDQAVARWSDKSSSGWHLTSPNAIPGGDATNRPLYKTNIVNGKPTVRTDGSNDFMRKNSGASITGGNLTVFVVSRRIAFINPNEGMFSVAKAGERDFDSLESAAIGVSDAATGTNLRDAQNDLDMSTVTHPANGVAFVYTSKYNGTNNTAYLNGAAGTPFSIATNFASTRLCLGFRLHSAETIGNPTNRDYAEILIYNVALSDVDRAAVESYLFSKWGITP